MYRVTTFLLLGLLALVCGFPTEKEVEKWRVVGGTNAILGDAPYQACLRSSMGHGHFCGGSLITTRTVVTASHCVGDGFLPSYAHVAVGTVSLNSGGDLYGVRRITRHPNHDPEAGLNDVAVVITRLEVVLTPFVALIPLSKSTVGAGVPALLTGWGYTAFPSDVYSDNLQKLTIKTITESDCRSALASVINRPITDSHICAFIRTGDGACRGDSGGPLVADGELIGIVNWGSPCARGYPDVFARVSYFYPWIVANSE